MDPLYRPQGVEERWQRTWEEEGLYNAEPDPSRESYVYAFPPPNVTGELHMGHALQVSLGDLLMRMKRMQGLNVLFQTGYDHAGISTQAAVEKQLVREGTSRPALGREAFEERVWAWLREYGGKIMFQFRRLGASMDYRRERFTMDEAYVRAVMRFFVHLYRKGWIYRANRIINWCPFHETSLSDLELIHADVDDTLTTIRYPLVDGSGHIAIATVRPATILADVAVAVHPEDERYRDLVGKEAIVPFVERRRADRRRRARRARVRHRRAQDHARPRPDRLRDRPRPRSARADGDRPGRTHERRGARGRGADAGGRRRPRARLVPRARSDREARALPPLRRTLRALREPDRAADLAAVVVCDGRAEAARARRAAGAPRPLPPRVAAPLRDRLARDRARLVHLAPALVGAPAADLVRRRRRGLLRRDRRGGPRARRWEGAHARRGRARHVVLVGPVAVRDARLARGDGEPEVVLPGRPADDRARDHPPLGEPDDLRGPRAARRGALHRRGHPLDRARAGRAAHVEEPRHRDRPARRDRRARRGRDALRPLEDVVDAGRPLQRRHDRGGSEAREQALERVAADPDSRRGCPTRSSARATSRSGGSSRGSTPRAPRSRPRSATSTSRTPSGALPAHVRRLLRLVRRGDQAAPARRRRRRGARPRSPRSSGC